MVNEYSTAVTVGVCGGPVPAQSSLLPLLTVCACACVCMHTCVCVCLQLLVGLCYQTAAQLFHPLDRFSNNTHIHAHTHTHTLTLTLTCPHTHTCSALDSKDSSSVPAPSQKKTFSFHVLFSCFLTVAIEE